MARGDLAEATATLESVGELPTDDTRDINLVHAVRVGIARRASDTGALADAWAEARTAVAGMSVDLFHLLPLGELLVGAARMQDEHWLAPQLQEAEAVLDGLGQPALWSAAFHWCGVQAAIVSDRPDALIPHADAISEAARVSRHAQTLASAGHTWVRVMGRDIDASAINLAVEGLSGIGLRWDASRLAAQAALHSQDRRVSLDLLNLARAAHSGHGSKSTSASTRSQTSQLTDREWQIARLVVQGIGYREIGERLYISPRTVEHHVASVRRRLGSPNRGEMIDTLRRLLVGSSTGEGSETSPPR
jgi:DNA-binding CsgD family transcriptional regulator